MFTEWLIEQQDRTDATGKLAKLCWDDYNSGCAGHFRGAGDWKKHFEASHGGKLDKIMELFVPAVTEYLESLTPRTDTN